MNIVTSMETLNLVVLVDGNDQEIGTTPKATVHHQNTPLHRAFSLYIFNSKGEILVQQRKREKITWGGFWSNSCCGHPGPGESREEAAQRRAKQELGLEVSSIEKIANYRYRFEYKGIVENEVCPIYVGLSNEEVQPDPAEIEDFKWMSWSAFVQDIKENANLYSPWSKEQVQILSKSPAFHSWLSNQGLSLV